MKKNIEIDKTKLIIWDLDDTFWKGNLAENTVEFLNENNELIEKLTTKGIVNSICSKNDLSAVKQMFVDKGYENLWDLFVFPSVNWLPKGQRIKQIISDMNLREENVLFIDDNEINLHEAKFYCPNLMTADASQIKILSKHLYLLNQYDLEHIRLQQYKMLETKQKAKICLNTSNEEFLKKSEIKISVNSDCEENFERLFSMIQRTNQLNFTKNRLQKEELKTILLNKNYKNRYIKVKDKYGNYGICGFYTYDKHKNELINFLFSCRILGMGIEQFIYENLNFPILKIKGDVSSTLEKNKKIDWIQQIDFIEEKKVEEKPKNEINILFKGPCDLLSTINYISTDCNID